MTITFHTHSGQFCRHAKDKLELMVQEYIRRGFRTIGLSEHCPRFKTEELYPEELDMSPEQLETQFISYVTEAKRLQTVYASKIEILVGAETEYLGPDYLQLLQPILTRANLDFLVGSIHHVNGIPIDFDVDTFQLALKSCQDSYATLFETYFDAQYELLQAFQPAVVGHFDLIRLFAPSYHESLPSDLTWSKIRRNVKFIIDYGGVFELNSRGWHKRLPSAYPLPDIASYIVTQGGKFTLADDAHATTDIALHYSLLPAYLSQLNVTTLYRLTRPSTISPASPSPCNWEPLSLAEVFEPLKD